ncbi:ATP-binding cassette sub-family C member 9-like [Acanthaster planci]|uniref:ATP-binding cassette sub-family C member 9-like n=1 Tax=Acanthaster planci TaxID=133434 RepID=A0A8B7ZL16_ACAPL|nr:ATP-binding cassette sub-family C member 9-like [Acanthaster planci]
MIFYSIFVLVEVLTLLAKFFSPFSQSGGKLPEDLQNPSMKYYMRFVSLPSLLVFKWLGWLMHLGYQRPLEISDLGDLPKMSSSRWNKNIFERCLQQEKDRVARLGDVNKFSLYRIMAKAYIKWQALAVVMKLMADSLNFVPPLTINGIITYASNVYYGKEEKDTEFPDYVTAGEFFHNGFVLIAIIFLAGVSRFVLLQNYYHVTIVSSIHLRVGLQVAVYDKTLRLSSHTLTSGEMTTGQITNYMSVDAQNIQTMFEFVHYAYSIPIQITVLLVMLYFNLGVAALVASCCFVIGAPIQYKLAKIQAIVKKNALKISDERLKQTHEMLQGMKLIKLYGWEKIFSEVITLVRTREIKQLTKAAVLYSLSNFLSFTTPALVTLLGFVLYSSFTGLQLTPAVAFTTLAIINQMRLPVQMIPEVTNFVVSAHVSVTRIKRFFLAEEIETSDDGPANCVQIEEGDQLSMKYMKLNDSRTQIKNSDSDGGIHGELNSSFDADDPSDVQVEVVQPGGYTNVHNHESPASPPSLPEDLAIKVTNGTFSWDSGSSTTLTGINVEIPKGKLTMIVGQVGTGKSSLLSALLGEMHTLTGTVQFNKKEKGVAYSAQRAWLLNASLRDNILFGQELESEKYQAVVSACSLQPDIDILPGGDQTEIGEKGINLSGGQKQRVSVARAIYSHHDIVILDDPLSALDVHVGTQLFEEGILDLLLENHRTVVLVTHQVQYIKYAHKVLVMKDGRIALQGTPDEVWKADPELKISRIMTAESDISEPEEERKLLQKAVEELKKEEQGIEAETEGTLMSKEEREKGAISWRVFLFYTRAMSYLLALLALSILLAYNGMMVGTDFWLSAWSEAGDRLDLENATDQEVGDTQMYYIGGYTGLAMASAVLSFVSTVSCFVAGLLASRQLHKSMLNVMSRAPMRFYDTTPIGRILNRFSSDVHTVDDLLPTDFLFLFEATFKCLSAIVVNTIVTPFFILAILPVAVCYVLLQHYYLRTSRELQRLDSITKSPIYAHFSETLSGLSTIRAYKDEERFQKNILDAIDRNVLADLNLNTCNRWLGVRLDFIGGLIVLLAGLTSLTVAVTSSTLAPSYVGLALSYALAASFYLNWFIRTSAMVEMHMNAVERIKYYCEVPTEHYKGKLPDPSWPEKGAVAMDDISVRYAENLDPVLEGLSLDIKAGQKIGICGRTGSGKSSLTLALFRIVDTFKGKIVIDSVDIASLPLDHLRQKLSIIPQDPILFTGTIRFNLDPLGQCSEEELWNALEIAQLKATVSEIGQGLESQVSEGGENFSVGQRQLFCLARAVLRKSRILIMDEATASIDMETDNIVQKVVAEEFKDQTILSIAHRVTTILNADRILVLNEGAVAEYDSPENLLAREDSLFTSLVSSAHQ